MEGKILKLKELCNSHPFDEGVISGQFEIGLNDYLLKLNTLPGPIARTAAVLARKKWDVNYEKQFDLIEYFFLQLIIILDSIMIWIMRHNSMIYSKSKKEITSSMLNLKAIGFWDWINLGRTLAKILRREGLDKNLDWIANKELYSNVERIEEVRNRIKGHSGNTSDSVFKKCINEALNVMNKVIDQISFFNAIDLITWRNFNIVDEAYTGDIIYFTWLISPYFIQRQAVNMILDSSKVYLLEKWGSNAIELGWFLRFEYLEDEQDYLAYFYNRIEDKQLRFVTYNEARTDKYYSSSHEELLNTLLIWK